VINFFKNIYDLYMKGAKANYFPISEYGLFGEKYKDSEVSFKELQESVDEASTEELKSLLEFVFDEKVD